MNMKKLALLLLNLFLLSGLFAVEGMWVPLFLDKYNIEDMQNKGLKLSAEDIYSINNTSLKDAVFIFGRGCTGSVISDKGLIITNYHCGHGIIQGHSSMENDILTDGFWAKSNEEELVNENLTAIFLIEMTDVTDKILSEITEDMTEKERTRIISEKSKKLEEEATKDNHYKAEVRAFFQGNQYFLIINEVFEDIRMVGVPPYSIGRFGGDTDNWMWPRHTGDFALFRIYTDPDGTPAVYSEENIPYKAKKHLPVSLSGTEKGDFTMVFGYPGTTMQYLPSFAVKQILEETYPNRTLIRGKKLDILNNAMDSDPEIRLQYSAKTARVSNAWKKWLGEIRGLNRLDAVNVKKQYEKEFTQWVNENSEIQQKYGNILKEYKDTYDKISPYSMAFDYFREAGLGSEAIMFASQLRGLENISKDNMEIIPKLKKDAKNHADNFYKDYHPPTDKKIFAEMIKLYYENIPVEFHPEYFKNLEKYFRKSEKPFKHFAEYCFNKSILTDEDKFYDFLENLNHRSIRIIEKDPFFILRQDFASIYREKIYLELNKYHTKSDSLHRVYMKAQLEFEEGKIFYPDANFTLRVSYGKIDTYYPADAVKYKYYTSLSGIMEKENPDIYDYKVNDRLKELYYAKDFGIYSASDGTMRVCFIASNHTTGGNSGSPVLNANGELIGVNFDRNWEGTMSDIMYDLDMCRNISIDIRYVLFIIDKFAGASHLIEEMEIRM